MLHTLPLSLQQHILLEWLSPSAVCALARSGSASLRRAVLTSPSAFRAAEGEVLRDACVCWFELRCGSGSLVLWTTVITDWWSTVYLRNGKRHRDGDLPAVLPADGTLYWYRNGKLHRDGDQPALIKLGGHKKQWFQDGKQHREGGLPAVVYQNGQQEWWLHNVLQKDNYMRR